MNPYAYVGGNPETLIDSTGHDWGTIGPFAATVLGIASGLVVLFVAFGLLASAPAWLLFVAGGILVAFVVNFIAGVLVRKGIPS